MKTLCKFIITNKSFRILLALALALIAVGALGQTFIFDCAQLDEIIRFDNPLFPEEREWYDENCVEEEEEIIFWPPLPPPTPRPPVNTCAELPPDIVVSGFRENSTQCQRLSAAGVGNASLAAMGILDAVDVWADVDAETRVCFRQQGSLKFLDAATAPRLVSDLAAEYNDGMTCGRINRVGTVVLMAGIASAGQPSSNEALVTLTNPTSTTGCELETTGYLSLRAGPSSQYARLLSMPEGRSLLARARIDDWFMVNYEGQWGWASGEYLAASPGCDALDDERAIILPPIIESGAPESEQAMTTEEETVPDAEDTETAAPERPLPSVCQLTAVYLLNLRAGPGLDYDVLAEVPYQTRLIASAKSGDWFKVDYEGLAGWVSREYVFRWGACYALGEDEAMMPQSSAAPPRSEVVEAGEMAESGAAGMTAPGATTLTGCNLRSGDIINLRQGPGAEYAVMAEIPYETSMNALARSGDWFMVEYLADTGWVNINYVFRSGACG